MILQAEAERLPRTKLPTPATVGDNAITSLEKLCLLREWAFPSMALAAVTRMDGLPLAVLAEWNVPALGERVSSGDAPVLVRRRLRDDPFCSNQRSVFQRLAFVALGSQASSRRVLGRVAPLGEVVFPASAGCLISPIDAAEFDWLGIRVIGERDGALYDHLRPSRSFQRTPLDGGSASVQVRLRHEQVFDLALRAGTLPALRS